MCVSSRSRSRTSSPRPRTSASASTSGSAEKTCSISSSIEAESRASPSVLGSSGEKCGSFKVPNTVDPLDIDAAFGSVRSTPDNPQAGKRASVWGMETMLRNGFEGLHRDGLDLTSSNDLINPDEALAHLVAQSIVNDVWEEVVGSRLTIANYFPRNEVQWNCLLSGR